MSPTKPDAILVGVGGGKGGVGKSMAAVNLAVAMAQTGKQTVLVDGDLGSPNLHSLLGIDKISKTVESLFTHEIEHLDEARMPTAVPNLTLVAGTAAAVGAANIAHTQKQKLLRHLHGMKADAVVIDVGAGTSFNTLDLFNAADVRIIVTTPQLTALQNAYSFAKSSVFRELRSLAAGKEQLDLLEDPRLNKDAAKLKSLVQVVRGKDAFFGSALREALDGMHLFVLGNSVVDERDASTFHAFSRMVKDFLSVECEVLGHLRNSRRAHDSVNRRRPVLMDEDQGDWGLLFRRIADKVLAMNVKALRDSRNRAQVTAAQAHAEAAPPPLPADLTEYARKQERAEVAMRGTLDGIEVEVVNLSADGALIRAPAGFEIGHRGLLQLTDGPSHGVEIRNSREPGMFGVQFVELARKVAAVG